MESQIISQMKYQIILKLLLYIPPIPYYYDDFYLSMQLSFERDLDHKQPIITLCTYESSYGLLSYSALWLVPSLHVSTSPSSLRTPTSQILEVSAHNSPILWKYFKFSFVCVHGFHLWPWVWGGIIVFITMSSSSLHFFLIQMLSTTQQPHWAHFSLQYYSFCLPSPDGWFGSLNTSVILLNPLTIWNIAKSNSILFYLSGVCVSYMYILAQVCVRARVSIKILFSITLHLGLLGFLLKKFDENIVTSFTPFPAFFTLPLTCVCLTLSNWWPFFGHYPLDSSVTCTHVPIHTQMISLQVHRSQERTQFLHCVHKHKRQLVTLWKTAGHTL